jgi:chemotaxis regulatin CheY-phosphate phosphatase CheZ
MNTIVKSDIEQLKLAPHHKVWIYIANRPLSASEQAQLIEDGKQFLSTWNAHGAEIKGDIKVSIDQVLIVSADQSHNENSGCSIDKLLRFIQGMEQQLNLQLLNRMLVPIGVDGNWTVVELQHLKTLRIDLQSAKIANVMVSDSDSFNSNFIQDLKQSWVGVHVN